MTRRNAPAVMPPTRIACPDCKGYVGEHSTPRCPRAQRARANRERWERFKNGAGR